MGHTELLVICVIILFLKMVFDKQEKEKRIGKLYDKIELLKNEISREEKRAIMFQEYIDFEKTLMPKLEKHYIVEKTIKTFDRNVSYQGEIFRIDKIIDEITYKIKTRRGNIRYILGPLTSGLRIDTNNNVTLEFPFKYGTDSSEDDWIIENLIQDKDTWATDPLDFLRDQGVLR